MIVYQLDYHFDGGKVIQTKNKKFCRWFRKIIRKNKVFGFSNLNVNQKLNSNEIRKLPDFLKIEVPETVYQEKLMVLRAKAYSLNVNDTNKNTLKGIKKNVKKQTTYEQCYTCLYGHEYDQYMKQNALKSKEHEVYMQTIVERVFDNFDDKRNYFNNIESVPFGTWKSESESVCWKSMITYSNFGLRWSWMPARIRAREIE